MLRLNCLLAPCVLALVINVGAADAAGHGGGLHRGSWQRNTNRSGHYTGGYYSGYGIGYVAIPDVPTEYVRAVPAPEPAGPLVLPTLALSCHRSQETITVPVESGGDRKITVTRC